jgi:hypothetical protein
MKEKTRELSDFRRPSRPPAFLTQETATQVCNARQPSATSVAEKTPRLFGCGSPAIARLRTTGQSGDIPYRLALEFPLWRTQKSQRAWNGVPR